VTVTVDVPDLPEGFVPFKVLMIVEGIDPTAGDEPTLAVRTTTGIKVWETLGMLSAATAIEQRRAADWWVDEGDASEG
jgi:hypothetical protein